MDPYTIQVFDSKTRIPGQLSEGPLFSLPQRGLQYMRVLLSAPRVEEGQLLYRVWFWTFWCTGLNAEAFLFIYDDLSRGITLLSDLTYLLSSSGCTHRPCVNILPFVLRRTRGSSRVVSES